MREWLKSRRMEKRLKCKEVAKQCGFTPEYYTMIENGNRRPSVEKAKAIAAVLEFEWTRFYSECKKTSA